MPSRPCWRSGPAFFVLYTYVQLVVGQEYLRYPGNAEWFFVLYLGTFVLAAVVAVRSWDAMGIDLPRPSRAVERFAAATLFVVAAFLILGLHLGTYLDALRTPPTRVEYLTSPAAFWIVKVMDLGIIVPLAVATAFGVLRGTRRARRRAYAVLGFFTVLAAAVDGMAITMLVRDDPDASAVNVVVFTCLTLTLAALTALFCRPLLAHPDVSGAA